MRKLMSRACCRLWPYEAFDEVSGGHIEYKRETDAHVRLAQLSAGT